MLAMRSWLKAMALCGAVLLAGVAADRAPAVAQQPKADLAGADVARG